MHGYKGRLLVADLGAGTTWNIPLDLALAKKLIGGSGYAAKFLLDHMDPATDPLGPGNMLLFMTGPLTGTQAPCTGRLVVCGKSPLTGFWGESHVGGHFGAWLKFAGYDGLLVKGASKQPVYLHVTNSTNNLLSAVHLWGKTTSETQEILAKDLGRGQVACIGPAGENLVKYAGIVHGERVAARCGLGAVMGSKKLKAVVVQGSEKVAVKEGEAFSELARSSSKILNEAMEALRKQGTVLYVDIGLMFNDMPIKYFQEVEFDETTLNAKAMEAILVGRHACYACPIGCGRRVTVPEYDLDRVAGPEYQTVAAFGTNLLIDDLKKISKMNSICNDLGMDTISCGSTIAFAMLLSEKGIPDWNLQWSDADAVMDILPQISIRQGLGAELAEGVKWLGEKYDVAEMAIHVKGLEVPNHDPRAFAGMTTVYATGARGASHLEGDMYSVDMGVEARDLGIPSGDRLENEGKGEVAAKSQSYRAFFDCLIMCHFAIVPNETILRLLSLATGNSLRVEEILLIGSRAVTLKRIFNLGCGLTPMDDRLPDPLLHPLPEEATENFVPDVSLQIREYYQYRKWDQETGWPRDEALRELGLDI